MLQNVELASRKKKIYIHLDRDSPGTCHDPEHFSTFPKPITYKFNSRGFRDAEWPTCVSELEDAIWCFGDSFTFGLGNPEYYTWLHSLKERTNRRVINVSMSGCSNVWIARKVVEVFSEIRPKEIVIHWPYIWKNELTDSSVPDEQRRVNPYIAPVNEMTRLFLSSISAVNSVVPSSTRVVHSVVPGTFDVDKNVNSLFSWKNIQQTVASLPDSVAVDYEQLLQIHYNFSKTCISLKDSISLYNAVKNLDQFSFFSKMVYIPEFTYEDLARDGYHYSVNTSLKFTDLIVKCL